MPPQSPVDPQNDPDFMKANPADQQRYLMANDPEFNTGTAEEQSAYLAHLTGKDTNTSSSIPQNYGFTAGNLANNLVQGAEGVVKGAYGIGKDLVNNPNWVEGENSTLSKFVEKPMLAESQKAAEELNRPGGSRMAAYGHALAGGVPLIGPWAASLGEQAGTGDIGGATAQGVGAAGTMAAVPAGMKKFGEGFKAGVGPEAPPSAPNPSALSKIPVASEPPSEPVWPKEYQNAPKTASSVGGGGANYSAEDLAKLKARNGISDPIARTPAPNEPPPLPPNQLIKNGAMTVNDPSAMETINRDIERRLGKPHEYTGVERRGLDQVGGASPTPKMNSYPPVRYGLEGGRSSLFEDPEQAARENMEAHGRAVESQESRRAWAANSPETPKGVLGDRMNALKPALRDVLGRDIDPADLTKILKETLERMNEYGPKKP